MSFAISEFRDVFIKLMNQDHKLFKGWYILEMLASINPGFIYQTSA